MRWAPFKPKYLKKGIDMDALLDLILRILMVIIKLVESISEVLKRIGHLVFLKYPHLLLSPSHTRGSLHDCQNIFPTLLFTNSEGGEYPEYVQCNTQQSEQ